jgi:hypothetical protein
MIPGLYAAGRSTFWVNQKITPWHPRPSWRSVTWHCAPGCLYLRCAQYEERGVIRPLPCGDGAGASRAPMSGGYRSSGFVSRRGRSIGERSAPFRTALSPGAAFRLAIGGFTRLRIRQRVAGPQFVGSRSPHTVSQRAAHALSSMAHAGPFAGSCQTDCAGGRRRNQLIWGICSRRYAPSPRL